MSNLEFAVGKRVVCIDDRRRTLYGSPCRPDSPYIVRGHVYTIRDICSKWPDGWPGVQLVGLHAIGTNGRESWFDVRRFRPVRETSIDCFTALLEKPPVRLREDA